MTVGEKILASRKKHGWTQAQLAEKSGVAAISIHQYETGKRKPQIKQLRKIAEVLEIELFDLLPDDLKEQFQNVPRYFDSPNEAERKLARKTEQILVENVMNEEVYERLLAISNSVYETVLDGLENVPDSDLKNVLLGSFSSLNRVGKREAVERVAELEFIPKYRRTEDPEDKE